MKSLSSPSVILWLEESVLVCIEADGSCSSLFEETVFVFRVHSKVVRRFRNRKSIAMRHRSNCWWYIRIHKYRFFLHGHTILNRGHHTEITVSTVIARHPSNYGHSKRHTTSFSIHPCIEFGRTRSAANVWCPLFVLVPYLTAEIQEVISYSFFIVGSNRTLPSGNVTSPQV